MFYVALAAFVFMANHLVNYANERDRQRREKDMAEVYVHATVKGYHPNNRYRVVDSHTVAEPGWSSGAGMWGLAENDRQVCPTPIGERCACLVVQRERS